MRRHFARQVARCRPYRAKLRPGPGGHADPLRAVVRHQGPGARPAVVVWEHRRRATCQALRRQGSPTLAGVGPGQEHRRWGMGARQRWSLGVAEFQRVALGAGERVSAFAPARPHGVSISQTPVPMRTTLLLQRLDAAVVVGLANTRQSEKILTAVLQTGKKCCFLGVAITR